MTTRFDTLRERFVIPAGVCYLDGNSLGPPMRATADQLAVRVQDEWGTHLIRAWNESGWMDEPRVQGDRIAQLIGAAPGSVVLGDTLSVKVYQALAAALSLQPDRKVVLSDTGNFPSDLYIADGLLDHLAQGHRLELVVPEAVLQRLGDDIAVLMLTHVDYRSGRLHDMQALTEAAHDHGIPVVWDLAHSAGAVPLALAAIDADFAVGCTYKYLNGGPGSPAFIHVAPRLHASLKPAIAGWLGHATPFAFKQNYQPAAGIDCLRIGTPAVLATAALDIALSVWDEVSIEAVRSASIELSERFIDEVESRCPMLELASPRDPQARGSQVSFRFEHGYAAIQALIQTHQVIGDFRAPDLMRFGFTPLYVSMDDVLTAVTAIERVMTGREWDQPQFARRQAVT